MAYEDYHFVNNPPEKSEEELRKEQEQKLNDPEYQKEMDELYKDDEEGYTHDWQKRNN